MKTTTLLGVLKTEGLENHGPTGSQPVTLVRPENRPLRNDGIRNHWLQAGFDYQLKHNGTGWQVTSPDWTGDWTGHVYYLVEPQYLRHVASLPAADGSVIDLVPGEVYELRETQPGGAWGLFGS
ncbi:hypothetical protein AB0A95_33810 [Micromonospora sp. NPDC049230]|uniref:hypothetical protein n=1 Tax=Micromonospora sp. NPDC049230 TaxID=3155502 RepID=UPI0033D31B93